MLNLKETFVKFNIIIFLLLCVSCKQNNYSSKSIVLLESDSLIVYTSKESFDNIFKKWFEEHKNNDYVLNHDKPLYDKIYEHYSDKPVNAYKIAEELACTERLNYKTADLLELQQAFIYNKLNKENETVIVSEFSIPNHIAGRIFKVKDKTILKVVDRVY